MQGKLKYQVKWVNYNDNPKEYLISSLKNFVQSLKVYYTANLTKLKLPANLDY